MAIQTKTGKSFEYACLLTLKQSLETLTKVIVDDNTSTDTARGFFNTLTSKECEDMLMAAKAATRVILRLEPKLNHVDDNGVLHLSIQEDHKGQDGDVRDVLCIRNEIDWEIGFSCKHNHSAVKHSRLSQTIDFGKKWFGIPCSKNYFDEISPLFSTLEQMKKDKLSWRELENKEEQFYIPLLNAFVSELRRLEQAHSPKIPKALIAYLLGRNDFYKIMAKNINATTQVQVFNFKGTLNQSYKNFKPDTKLPVSALPDKIFDISYKKNTNGSTSNNTVIITCNNGWAVSLRIHNASSKVEPSLKFDVTLIGTPSSFYNIVEPW